ncbi:MAG: hypothetical protein M3537_04365 [Chloroflexota bacterium]|nr:hypothetical protein [Chloroflexota bacterium]
MNRPFSSTSRLGGNPPLRREKSSIACAYCSPRKISSASRSRLTAVRQTGSAMLMRIAITLMPTSSAAIA